LAQAFYRLGADYFIAKRLGNLRRHRRQIGRPPVIWVIESKSGGRAFDREQRLRRPRGR
jgi:hypothetical protein